MKLDNIEVYEGGLETTYIKVHDLHEDMSIVLTFFPETDQEVEIEISAEDFYRRLVLLEPLETDLNAPEECEEY